ncbi:MAG TPA: hypothetical protein VFS59_12750, partial [Gemmatimonadaceae bacterium]|nr:hypothetical protein [Gemmatimonadaceae bacterium]
MTSLEHTIAATLRMPAPRRALAAVALATLGACAQTTATSAPGAATSAARSADPRVDLKPGLWDAGEAVWNLRVVSKTPPPERFVGGINSDLAFLGTYVIQGSFRGYQVWDITNPAKPALRKDFFCPASQSDVSVYKNLLFVSGEDLSARLDCGAQGVSEAVSKDRLRGIRIFDITDIANPRNVGNVQTCRGSHTHTVLVDPKDSANVYVYISGAGPVRSDRELAGCVDASPEKDPNSALFRIEVIKVPVAHPEQAAIVSSPRIFTGLTGPRSHGEAPEDRAAQQRIVDSARRAGGFIVKVHGEEQVAGPNFVRTQLDSIVKARGGSGAPTGADSAKLRADMQLVMNRIFGPPPAPTARPVP